MKLKLLGYQEVHGNYVHPTATVYWDKIDIGIGNVIYPNVCIGTEPQHLREEGQGIIEIGDNNIFRENVVVTLPTKATKKTKIGNNNYLMSSCIIHHDCVLEDNITVSNHCSLSGHVHVMKGAVLGLNVNVHQFQVIGSYSMLGMGTVVVPKNKIVPGKVFVGTPARILKSNRVGIQRNNVTEEDLQFELERYTNIYEEMRK